MNGILLVDKPAGWTSSDVVAKLRGVLHEKRIGHSGTLDPMATGLLVVFVGRATRAVEFAEGHEKRYLAGLRLGLATDTQDTTGRPVGGAKCDISREQLEAVLPRFRGEIMQIPPMYSAIKIKGQKLYEIARRGGEVERKARPVIIDSLEIAGERDGDFLLDIRCSKGTYVRTLCHEIGAALGCGGCMSSLRRTEAGDFRLEDALPLEQIIARAEEREAEKLLLPVDGLFAAYPKLMVGAAEEKRIRNGSPVSVSAADGDYRVYHDGAFLALSRVRDGVMSSIKSFYEV